MYRTLLRICSGPRSATMSTSRRARCPIDWVPTTSVRYRFFWGYGMSQKFWLCHDNHQDNLCSCVCASIDLRQDCDFFNIMGFRDDYVSCGVGLSNDWDIVPIEYRLLTVSPLSQAATLGTAATRRCTRCDCSPMDRAPRRRPPPTRTWRYTVVR